MVALTGAIRAGDLNAGRELLAADPGPARVILADDRGCDRSPLDVAGGSTPGGVSSSAGCASAAPGRPAPAPDVSPAARPAGRSAGTGTGRTW